jgi:hypothetical protein
MGPVGGTVEFFNSSCNSYILLRKNIVMTLVKDGKASLVGGGCGRHRDYCRGLLQ